MRRLRLAFALYDDRLLLGLLLDGHDARSCTTRAAASDVHAWELMIKKLLFALGLAKAPAPVKSYLAVSSFVGTVPALAWLAWKNRRAIQSAVRRVTARPAATA